MVSLNSGDVSAGNQNFILLENAFLELLEDLLRTWLKKQRENQNSDGSAQDSQSGTPAQEPAKSQQKGKQDFGQQMLVASDRQILQKTQAITALLLLRDEPTYESQFYRLENQDNKSVIQDMRTNQTIMEFRTNGTSIEILKDKTNLTQRDEWLIAAQGLVNGKNAANDMVNPYEAMHEELNRLGGLAPLEYKGILAANYLLNLHQTSAFQANERNVNRYIFSRLENGGVQIIDKTTNEEIISYTPEGTTFSLKLHHVRELSEIYDVISLPNKDPGSSVLSGQLDYMLHNPSEIDIDIHLGGQLKQGLSQRQSPQPIRAASNQNRAAEGYQPSVKEMALWLAAARGLGKSEEYQNSIKEIRAGMVLPGDYEKTIQENPDFRGSIQLTLEQFGQMQKDISAFQGIINDSGFEVALKRVNRNTPQPILSMSQAVLNRQVVSFPKASDISNSTKLKQSNKER